MDKASTQFQTHRSQRTTSFDTLTLNDHSPCFRNAETNIRNVFINPNYLGAHCQSSSYSSRRIASPGQYSRYIGGANKVRTINQFSDELKRLEPVNLSTTKCNEKTPEFSNIYSIAGEKTTLPKQRRASSNLLQNLISRSKSNSNQSPTSSRSSSSSYKLF